MFSFIRKVPVVALVALMVGLSTTGFFYFKQGGLKAEAKETILVPVPLIEISAYTSITRNDIVMKEFPKGTDLSSVATQTEEIIGKVAVNNLQKEVPISLNDISDADKLPNLNVVSVYVDQARSAGAQPGDIVDVYWIQVDATGQAIAKPVAANARIVEVGDGKTESATVAAINNTFKTPTGTSNIYRLMVKPEEVSGVVAGGSPKNTSVALVKKFSESQPVAIQTAQSPKTTQTQTLKGVTK
ncbi:hypothetical protein ACOBQJ_03285 [Pelotomaculum propionicicum]|uniref:hypothetical protein n=1 Tax=Pelotomaculum propionicicum TaxID=258475 RepID=UPI003B7F7143